MGKWNKTIRKLSNYPPSLNVNAKWNQFSGTLVRAVLYTAEVVWSCSLNFDSSLAYKNANPREELTWPPLEMIYWCFSLFREISFGWIRSQNITDIPSSQRVRSLAHSPTKDRIKLQKKYIYIFDTSNRHEYHHGQIRSLIHCFHILFYILLMYLIANSC